jgi:lysophospholipase L1-like esterase
VGGTVSDTILGYHNDFVYALERAGIVDKIWRLNTFSGDSFTSALVPLIRRYGNAADHSFGFVSGNWTAVDGLKGDAATTQLRTGIMDSAVNVADLSLIFAGKSFEQTATTNTAIGALTGSTSPQISLHVRRTTNPNAPAFAAASFGSANKELGFAATHSQGFISGSCTSLGPMRVYFQGNLENNQVAGTNRTAPTTSSARDFYVFSRNFGAPYDTGTACYGHLYSIALGLTDDQMWDFFNAFYTLNVSLGREALVSFLSCWGDSLTSGTGGSPFPLQMFPLGAANRAIYNGGVGGEDSSQVLARFTASTRRADQVTTIWVGQHGTDYTNPTLCMSNIAAMVAHLTTSKFVILTALNDAVTQPINTTGYNQIQALNALITSTYPNNSLDIRAYLLTQGDGGATDNADVANGVTPTSLRFDSLHLNTLGYSKVASRVQTFLTAKGW